MSNEERYRERVKDAFENFLVSPFIEYKPYSMSDEAIIADAKERYKEFNKLALESSPMSDEIRKEISSQIDLNAEKQKNRWISILQVKGIIIIK